MVAWRNPTQQSRDGVRNREERVSLSYSTPVNMHLKPTATCFSDNFGSTSIRGQGFKVMWVVYMASWLAPNILDGKGIF
ncbi:hypothetical protein NC651_005709 [Populus alba x Populus x berolinensis]|nr:hypothetical protein NC651_005709 [Populus alba x Populus x berolinensis]